MTTEEQRRHDAIGHVVHDWALLVTFGDMLGRGPAYPVNHACQNAFLVECRKFADFFHNHRGKDNNDIVSKEFVVNSSRRFKPKIPVWDHWELHINPQLMHLSYGRVSNTTSWDGNAIAPIFAEMKSVWFDFISCLHSDYVIAFQTEMKKRGL